MRVFTRSYRGLQGAEQGHGLAEVLLGLPGAALGEAGEAPQPVGGGQGVGPLRPAGGEGGLGGGEGLGVPAHQVQGGGPLDLDLHPDLVVLRPAGRRGLIQEVEGGLRPAGVHQDLRLVEQQARGLPEAGGGQGPEPPAQGLQAPGGVNAAHRPLHGLDGGLQVPGL
jgi:hypothetical protein